MYQDVDIFYNKEDLCEETVIRANLSIRSWSSLSEHSYAIFLVICIFLFTIYLHDPFQIWVELMALSHSSLLNV